MKTLTLLILSWTCMVGCNGAEAHDAKGLMILDNLPADARTAIQERVFIRRHSQSAWRNDPVAWQGLQSVVRKTAVWTPGISVSVCFMDGSEAARERVMAVAETWVHYGPKLQFDYGDSHAIRKCDPAHPSLVRVTFLSGGYASQIGQDALLVPANMGTLFLQGLDDPGAPDSLMQEIVLHEFGHAIGFEHEHQSPKGHCEAEFDWPKVYAYFATLGWDRAMVDQNLRTLPNTSVYDASKFDSKSIMHYQFDGTLFVDPAHATCLVGTNRQLSAQDIVAVGQYYGASAAPLDVVASAAALQELSVRPRLSVKQRGQVSEVLKALPKWSNESNLKLKNFQLNSIQ